MSPLAFRVAVSAWGLTVLAGGCDGSGRNATDAASPPDPLVAALRETRMEGMCKDGAYERACFEVDRDGCRKLVAEHYDACVKDHASELTVAAKRTPEEIGTLLGGCTAKRYIEDLEGKGRIDRTGRCEDPSSFFR
jgi:hypothetical protein